MKTNENASELTGHQDFRAERLLGIFNFKGPFWEGLIFGGAYIRRELCVSKSVRLILGGKFASQNRLG